jgi:hypothetical protein
MTKTQNKNTQAVNIYNVNPSTPSPTSKMWFNYYKSLIQKINWHELKPDQNKEVYNIAYFNNRFKAKLSEYNNNRLELLKETLIDLFKIKKLEQHEIDNLISFLTPN